MFLSYACECDCGWKLRPNTLKFYELTTGQLALGEFSAKQKSIFPPLRSQDIDQQEYLIPLLTFLFYCY